MSFGSRDGLVCLCQGQGSTAKRGHGLRPPLRRRLPGVHDGGHGPIVVPKKLPVCRGKSRGVRGSVPFGAAMDSSACARYRAVLPGTGRAACRLAAAPDDASAAATRPRARTRARRSRRGDSRGCARGASGCGQTRPAPRFLLGLGRPPRPRSLPPAGALAGQGPARRRLKNHNSTLRGG